LRRAQPSAGKGPRPRRPRCTLTVSAPERDQRAAERRAVALSHSDGRGSLEVDSTSDRIIRTALRSANRWPMLRYAPVARTGGRTWSVDAAGSPRSGCDRRDRGRSPTAALLGRGCGASRRGWAAAMEVRRPYLLVAGAEIRTDLGSRAVRVRAACAGGSSAVRVKMGPGLPVVCAVEGSIWVARRVVPAGYGR
jgi:hypothetical protein